MNSNPPLNGNGRPHNNGPAPVPPPPGNKLPRSPRAALEPERVPPPSRRSKRVRHPLVVFGNAVFTLLVIITLLLVARTFSASSASRLPVR